MAKWTIETVKKHWKRYLVSSLITFTSGFLLAVVPEINNLDPGNLRVGAFVGVALVGLRAGLKALGEWLMKFTGDPDEEDKYKFGG